MSFEVRITQRQAGHRSGDVYELIDPHAGVRAEVWPMWGFNCLNWQIRDRNGDWFDLLYATPDWETNPLPTRNGHPILFPFPGRIRYGRFQFRGKCYQLPLNDSTQQHSIHGFTPRNPWQVLNCGATKDHAFITGRFHLGGNIPTAKEIWPSDFQLEVIYRLSQSKLRVEAQVHNVGLNDLPFGLGYHGYFRLPGAVVSHVDDFILQVNAKEVWDAIDHLPTGRRIPVPEELDFRQPRQIGNRELDQVLTGLHDAVNRITGLRTLASLSHASVVGTLEVQAQKEFGHLVLFTPPHRQSLAIEPYTCSADAPNLHSLGIESGWRVLPPGETWQGVVTYSWNDGSAK
jgi:aldose 1-epimerase